jgi:hypothetical protein
METDRLIVDICENGTFGAFAEDEGGWKGDFLSETERGVIFAENTEYSV